VWPRVAVYVIREVHSDIVTVGSCCSLHCKGSSNRNAAAATGLSEMPRQFLA